MKSVPWLLFLMACSLFLPDTTLGTVCVSNSKTGTEETLQKTDILDNVTGEGILLHDVSTRIQCCGTIKEWRFFARNPGTIFFLVWRQVSSLFFYRIGHNKYDVQDPPEALTTFATMELFSLDEVNTPITLAIPEGERIPVIYGDHIGWWTRNESMIPYSREATVEASLLMTIDNLNEILLTQDTDWMDAAVELDRRYAIQAVLEENRPPSFVGVPSTLRLKQEELKRGETILVLNGTDEEPMSSLRLKQMDSLSDYFRISSLVNVYLDSVPPLGVYYLRFFLHDTCGAMTMADVEVEIYEQFTEVWKIADDQRREFTVYESSHMDQYITGIRSDVPANYTCYVAMTTPHVDAFYTYEYHKPLAMRSDVIKYESVCVDKVDCKSYGNPKYVCSFGPWAKKNCKHYCDNCPEFRETLPALYLRAGAELGATGVSSYTVSVECIDNRSNRDAVNITVHVSGEQLDDIFHTPNLYFNGTRMEAGDVMKTFHNGPAFDNNTVYCESPLCPFELKVSPNNEYQLLLTAKDSVDDLGKTEYKLFVDLGDKYLTTVPRSIFIFLIFPDREQRPVIAYVNSRGTTTYDPPVTRLQVSEDEDPGSAVVTLRSGALVGAGHFFAEFALDICAEYFFMAKVGDLIVFKRLDFRYLQSHNATVCEVRVELVDDVTVSIRHIIYIEITDIEETPEFDYSIYRVTFEELEAGQPLPMDPLLPEQKDPASIMDYFIDCGENEQYISVDPSTGVLSMDEAVDIDVIQESEYVIECAYTAATSTGLSAETTVKITVKDGNDNDPVFSRQEYTFCVKRTTTIGSYLGSVQVQDADLTEKYKRIMLRLEDETAAIVDDKGNLYVVAADIHSLVLASENEMINTVIMARNPKRSNMQPTGPNDMVNATITLTTCSAKPSVSSQSELLDNDRNKGILGTLVFLIAFACLELVLLVAPMCRRQKDQTTKASEKADPVVQPEVAVSGPSTPNEEEPIKF